jgi:hypothetical protein
LVEAGTEASAALAGEGSGAALAPPFRRGSAVIEFGGIGPAGVSSRPKLKLEEILNQSATQKWVTQQVP